METHFNKLSPAEDERLACLLEEMGEAIQIIGKIQRHGYESCHPDDPSKATNRQLLEKEVGHVLATASMMTHASDLTDSDLYAHSEKKIIKIQRYLHHQNPELFGLLESGLSAKLM